MSIMIKLERILAIILCLTFEGFEPLTIESTQRDENISDVLLSQREWERGEEVVFVAVDNVALIFMLVMSFLGTTNMNIIQIGNIKKANIQH